MDLNKTTSPTSPLSSSTSRHSAAHSDYLASSQSISGNSGSNRGKNGKRGYLNRLKGWLTTSEPSAKALKQHKMDTFQKAGVSTKDPSANSKIDAPLGQIPEDAIRTAGKGPDPEQMARQRVEQRRQIRESYAHLHGASRNSQSYTSSVSTSSVKDNVRESAQFNSTSMRPPERCSASWDISEVGSRAGMRRHGSRD